MTSQQALIQRLEDIEYDMENKSGIIYDTVAHFASLIRFEIEANQERKADLGRLILVASDTIHDYFQYVIGQAEKILKNEIAAPFDHD